MNENKKKNIDDFIVKIDNNVIYVNMLAHEAYKPIIKKSIKKIKV